MQQEKESVANASASGQKTDETREVNRKAAANVSAGSGQNVAQASPAGQEEVGKVNNMGETNKRQAKQFWNGSLIRGFRQYQDAERNLTSQSRIRGRAGYNQKSHGHQQQPYKSVCHWKPSVDSRQVAVTDNMPEWKGTSHCTRTAGNNKEQSAMRIQEFKNSTARGRKNRQSKK